MKEQGQGVLHPPLVNFFVEKLKPSLCLDTSPSDADNISDAHFIFHGAYGQEEDTWPCPLDASPASEPNVLHLGIHPTGCVMGGDVSNSLHKKPHCGKVRLLEQA